MFALSVKVIALWGSAGKIRQTLAHVMTAKRTLSFFFLFNSKGLLTNMPSVGPFGMRNICFLTHSDRLRESFTLAQKQSVSSSPPPPKTLPPPCFSLIWLSLVGSRQPWVYLSCHVSSLALTHAGGAAASGGLGRSRG